MQNSGHHLQEHIKLPLLTEQHSGHHLQEPFIASEHNFTHVLKAFINTLTFIYSIYSKEGPFTALPKILLFIFAISGTNKILAVWKFTLKCSLYVNSL